MNKISNIEHRRVGLIIRRERERKHLTLDQLAKHLDMGRSTLNLYETGQRNLPSPKAHIIATALELDPCLIDLQAA